MCRSVLSSLIPLPPRAAESLGRKQRYLWAQFSVYISFFLLSGSEHFTLKNTCELLQEWFIFIFLIKSYSHVPLKIYVKISQFHCAVVLTLPNQKLPSNWLFSFLSCIFQTDNREAINTLNDGVYTDQFFPSPFHCAVDIKDFWEVGSRFDDVFNLSVKLNNVNANKTYIWEFGQCVSLVLLMTWSWPHLRCLKMSRSLISEPFPSLLWLPFLYPCCYFLYYSHSKNSTTT